MSILKVSIRQIKAARALLDWSQEELAKASGVSIATIKRLEAADDSLGGREETQSRLCKALEAQGVEFLGQGGLESGVRIRAKKSTGPQRH